VRPLNFASQPARNERLPALLFAVAAVALVGLTVRQAVVVRGLLPARTSKLHREVATLEAELDRLRAEGRTLTAPKPGKQELAEWSVLKDLVDRRTFSWTGLFARLETVLPREVRIVTIAPDVKNGQVVLDIVAVAKPAQVGLGLVGVLERRAEFEDVYPLRVTEKDGGEAEFNYTMRYLPAALRDEIAPVAAAVDEVAAPAEAGPAGPAVAQPALLSTTGPQPAVSAAPAPKPLPSAPALPRDTTGAPVSRREPAPEATPAPPAQVAPIEDAPPLKAPIPLAAHTKPGSDADAAKTPPEQERDH